MLVDVPADLRYSEAATGARCRQCGCDGPAHEGVWCAICRQPVEHHTPDRPFQDCLEGRIRMATARRNAGIPLSPLDEIVLTYSSIL